MNNNVDIPALKNRYATVVAELDNYYDPIDKIEHLGNFIKELLKAYGTNEVLLATPVNVALEYDLLSFPETEAAKNEEDKSEEFVEFENLINETSDKLKQNQTIQWMDADWIREHNGLTEMDIYHYNNSVWFHFLIVRIGIVDGDVKFTWQQCQSKNLDDCEDYEKETDWLILGNMAVFGVKFLIKLINLLLSCPEIWEYTFKYPQLHKLR